MVGVTAISVELKSLYSDTKVLSLDNSYYLTAAFPFAKNILQRVSLAWLKTEFSWVTSMGSPAEDRASVCSSLQSFQTHSKGRLMKTSPFCLSGVPRFGIPNETQLGHHWRWLLCLLSLRPVTQTSNMPDFDPQTHQGGTHTPSSADGVCLLHALTAPGFRVWRESYPWFHFKFATRFPVSHFLSLIKVLASCFQGCLGYGQVL